MILSILTRMRFLVAVSETYARGTQFTDEFVDDGQSSLTPFNGAELLLLLLAADVALLLTIV